MNRPHVPEAHPMVIVDCPLCDGPAPFEPLTGDLDCPGCGVRLAVHDDPAARVLAEAA